MQKTSTSDSSHYPHYQQFPLHFIINTYTRPSKSMKRDQESLLRMNFLIQAARIYANSAPEYSQHFIYDFLQVSEKKMIRIDKPLKKKIDKKRFTLKKAKHLACYLPNNPLQDIKPKEQMQVEHPQ